MASASAAYDLVLNDHSAVGRRSFLNSLDTIENRTAALAVGGFAALGVAGVAAFTAMYNAQAPLIDELGKLSESTGIGVVKLQSMADAAARAGISQDALNGSLKEGLKRISEAAAGSGEAGKILAKMGLSAEELRRQAPEVQIQKIFEALEDVDNVNDRLQFADKIFGGQGIDLIRLTGSAINDAEQEMRDLGIALQEVDVESVERLNDEIQRIERNVNGAQKVFVGVMAPAIVAVMETMFNLGDASVNVRESFVGMADGVISVVGFVGDRVNDIRRFIKGLEFTFQNMGTNIYRFMDSLPGLDFGEQIKIEFDKGIEIYSEYLAIDENGKFSERLKTNLAKVREEAEGAAKAIRDAQAGIDLTESGGTGSGDESAANDDTNDPDAGVRRRALEAYAEKIRREEEQAALQQERELERQRQFGLSETEILLEQQARTEEALDAIAARDIERVGEVNAIKQAANERYHDQYLAIVARSNAKQDKLDQKQMAAGRAYLEQGIAHFAQKSEGADAIHKALVARRMFREGREAVIGAYKWGNSIGGPFVGGLFAGIAGAYTAALIAETVGGGSSAPNAPAVGAIESEPTTFGTVTSDTQQAANQSTQTVIINYYKDPSVSTAAADAEARRRLDEDIAAKRITVGDSIDVTVNVFDYEEFGT